MLDRFAEGKVEMKGKSQVFCLPDGKVLWKRLSWRNIPRQVQRGRDLIRQAISSVLST